MEGISGLGGLSGSSMKSMMEARFAKVDQDGNGSINLEELQSKVDETGRGNKLLENFDSVDSDGDGELTQSELQSFRSGRGGRPDGVGGGPPNGDRASFQLQQAGNTSTSLLELLQSSDEEEGSDLLNSLTEGKQNFISQLIEQYGGGTEDSESLLSSIA